MASLDHNHDKDCAIVNALFLDLESINFQRALSFFMKTSATLDVFMRSTLFHGFCCVHRCGNNALYSIYTRFSLFPGLEVPNELIYHLGILQWGCHGVDMRLSRWNILQHLNLMLVVVVVVVLTKQECTDSDCKKHQQNRLHVVWA